MLSAVLILPVAQVETGNAVAEAMGWGPNNYGVPLSASGEATHYGLHAWASDGFCQMIETGFYPPELAGAVTEAAFTAMLAALIYSFRDDHAGQFAEVCAANKLKVVGDD